MRRRNQLPPRSAARWQNSLPLLRRRTVLRTDLTPWERPRSLAFPQRAQGSFIVLRCPSRSPTNDRKRSNDETAINLTHRLSSLFRGVNRVQQLSLLDGERQAEQNRPWIG